MLTHRLALAALLATFVLILFGGLVTNTGSGLAVPDWPTTFGHNMFLFPWSGMVGGVFYEHGHRLIGSLVGLLTVALAAALWSRGGVWRWLGVAALVGVVAQGVLGGLRVVLLRQTLAIVHGCLAQGFTALLAVIAFLTARSASDGAPAAPAPARSLARVAAVVVAAQVVTGALLTHATWLVPHLVGAVVTFAVVPMATARVRRGQDPVATRLARIVVGLLIVQLFLGVGALLARFTSLALPAQHVTGLALPVGHRVLGAMILAATVVMALRAEIGGRLRGAMDRRVPLAPAARSSR